MNIDNIIGKKTLILSDFHTSRLEHIVKTVEDLNSSVYSKKVTLLDCAPKRRIKDGITIGGRIKDHTDKFIKDYIKKRKQETIPNYYQTLQLGMTYKEVEKIRGTPKFINEMNEVNRYFQMWTYSTESNISHLYFEDHKLIRIDE